jgi:hypothetical protein
MKTVLLSADGDVSAYEVPDIVANHLTEYCGKFHEWLWNSPHAERFHVTIGDSHGVGFRETDFVEYLNVWIFPEEPSRFIETVGTFDVMASERTVPETYKDYAWLNF